MQKRLNHIMNTNAPCLRGDGENIWAISCLPESRQGKRILEKWSKNNKKLQTGRTSWKPPKPEPTTLFLLGNWSSGIVQAKWQSRKCAVDSQSLECLMDELKPVFFRGKKKETEPLTSTEQDFNLFALQLESIVIVSFFDVFPCHRNKFLNGSSWQ